MFNATLLFRIGLAINIIVSFFCSTVNTAQAQEKPPVPISIYVNPAQVLSFGAFSHGNSGGTLSVYANGSRSATGDIIPVNLGFSFSPAIFEIEANPGTVVSILNGPDVNLSGSNGGSMQLRIGSADVGSTFITTATPPSRTQVRIGGTLTIGSALANPPGEYSGTFSVTFIQE